MISAPVRNVVPKSFVKLFGASFLPEMIKHTVQVRMSYAMIMEGDISVVKNMLIFTKASKVSYMT